MTTQDRVGYNKTDGTPRDLSDLQTLVAGLPPEHKLIIEPALKRVLESTKRRQRILGLVQEALSQLRLDMKYLLFDLEATRRERDEFRKIIDGDPEV